jgi:CRISPR system Cascade subunit CasE
MANPTKRLSQNSRERDGQPVKSESVGKRVPVLTEKLEEWLEQRAGPAGFRVERLSSVQAGYVYWSKNTDGSGNRLRFARYDGILQVTDPTHFHDALMRGTGPGKAYGCGLLSIAPPIPPIAHK